MPTPDETRIKVDNLIKEKGYSLNELSIRIGREQTYLYQYVNRKSPKRLPVEERRKLAKILEVDEQQLTDIELGARNEIGELGEEMAKIEIIDASASCGMGIENFHPVVVGHNLISMSNLREITNSKPNNIKILKARGDSMEPTINDSDVIWVDISYKQPTVDGIYLFCMNGELFVKRIQIDFIKKSFIIKSDNPRYEPIIATSNDNVEVVGKVISINKMLG